MRGFLARSVGCAAAVACVPGVARADALDALEGVAEAIFAVWAVIALPLLGFACLAPPTSTGGRVATSVLLLVAWAPALLFTFGAEIAPLGLLFLGGVGFGLFRVWTSSAPPNEA